MLNFVLLDANNSIVNTIIADTQEAANEFLEQHNAVTALLVPEDSFYNTTTHALELKPVVEVPEVVATISKATIMSKLTMEELTTLYTAAKTNVILEVWLDKLKATETFQVTDPFFNVLVEQDIISAARLAEILA